MYYMYFTILLVESTNKEVSIAVVLCVCNRLNKYM